MKSVELEMSFKGGLDFNRHRQRREDIRVEDAV